MQKAMMEPGSRQKRQLSELDRNPLFAVMYDLVKETYRHDVISQVLQFMFGVDHELTGNGLEPIGDGHYFWKHGALRCFAAKDWIEIESGAQKKSG
ncbi:hypothetical protein AB6A23_10735 [Paenibacillus tarimensis]